jgi:ribonuclease J
MSVKIGFLGGLGEVGRNCASIEIDGEVALIDCGLMFPEEDMLGVDLVLPDFTSVLDRADDFKCVILTHGHEDHIGALVYLLRDVNVPIYGTRLTSLQGRESRNMASRRIYEPLNSMSGLTTDRSGSPTFRSRTQSPTPRA